MPDPPLNRIQSILFHDQRGETGGTWLITDNFLVSGTYAKIDAEMKDTLDPNGAIDPDTGEPAELPGFHFIRLTSGVNVLTKLGEKSPEIDGVADVAPDPIGDVDEDGDIDLFDMAVLMICFESGDSLSDPCLLLDFDANESIDLEDYRSLAPRMTGPM